MLVDFAAINFLIAFYLFLWRPEYLGRELRKIVNQFMKGWNNDSAGG